MTSVSPDEDVSVGDTRPPVRAPGARDLARAAIGRRADWRLVRPSPTLPRPTVGWVGTAIVVATVAGSWFAFDDADGRGSVALGLFVGAASILLMSWSFVLATRLRPVEALFGGLDSAYRVHRWAGALAVVAMFLHIRIEPDIRGGIRGAGESLAEAAEELAGLAEIALYVLVAISVVRWIPYRWWRLSHKLLGIPYVFACAHFFTAEKPYANGSAWGWWFGAWMVVGTVAWLYRVVARDAVRPGRRYRVTSAVPAGATLDLRLSPVDGRPLAHEPGQFAFLKLQVPGLREPHPFTIASPPDEPELRFLVRALGDWSHRAQHTPLVGHEVLVEGPYGHFRPLAERLDDAPRLWVAGGVGITPFLAAISTTGHASSAPRHTPTLVYCVRRRADAMALPELEAAAAAGRIRLSLHVSDEHTRLDTAQLASLLGRDDLRGVDVAVCGPHALVAAVVESSRRLHAREVHTEDFDIRQGIGPDLSMPIDAVVRGLRPSTPTR